MGKVGKGVGCSISACSNEAERSISREQLAGSSLSIGSEGRSVYLCKDHYTAWKKTTRESRSLERARWG
ncbi:MAG: hypothetical protein HYY68_00875 [Thaumarchaeota archaeon]|nr:hypothetical protein [Nitrososphaerota archaeon]